MRRIEDFMPELYALNEAPALLFLCLLECDTVNTATSGRCDQAIENLLTKEWLLTNGRGSYASSTVVGCNTRAYHGLLIGSLRPPANRVMALSNCLEMIISKGQVFNLSTFEFADKFAPAGYGLLKRFRQDVGVHFDYELENVELTRSVYLLRDTNTAAIVYDFTGVREPVEFISRPFVGLRDFHALQKSYATLSSNWVGSQSGGLLVRYETQWWFNFVYRSDRERGQAFTEDLWTPGFFKCRIDSPARVVLWARLAERTERIANTVETERCDPSSVDKVRKDLWRHQEGLKRRAKAVKHDFKFPIADCRLENSNLDVASPKFFESFCLAADAFVTERQTETGRRTTILAGY
ncbi:MAG: glycogen debranching enzyme N-terminal domain-containing protein, partial [Planctomycetota bacterium]